MGRGRKPKSSQYHVAAGSWEKNPQRRRTGDPEAIAGRPAKPADLPPIASDEWDRLAALLDAMGCLCVDSGPVLEQISQAYADWKLTTQQINRDGLMVDGKPHSLLAVRDRVATHYRRLLIDCGLTPTARPGLRKNDSGASNDPVAKLIQARSA